MNRNKNKNTNNFLYLKLFFIFVFACIAVSSFIKMKDLVNTSSFNLNYFNILVAGKNAYVVGISKNDNSINVLELKGADIDSIKKNQREKLSVDFGIPLDAVFIDRKERPFKDPKEFFSFKNITGFIFNPSSYKSEQLNKLDLLKIYLATYSVSLFDVKSMSYDVSKQNNDEEGEKLFEYFKDKQVLNEKISLEVINSSGIDGGAGRVAKMLKNGGFNVVSIKSLEEKKKASGIICRSSGGDYTVERIGRIFSLIMDCKEETGIADISIIIGEDGKWIGE